VNTLPDIFDLKLPNMRYYRINPLILFRHYGDFGYLTDNRNFGYNFIGDEFTLGDEIVSESGADILSCLEKKPLSIDEIMNRVNAVFEHEEDLHNDVIEFLELLNSKGFVLKGDTAEKCERHINADVKKVDVNLTKSKETTFDTQAFLAERFGENPFPTSIHVEIASECNERCVHCYIPHEFKQDLMEKELFLKILHQAREMNLLHITISGGEPMLHPYFIDFLKACRLCDMSVNILSNLTLLDDGMVEEMKRNPLLSVQTSVYSMEADIHDGITCKKNSLNKTIASVVKLAENHIPIQISCPILKANYKSYKGVKHWAAEYKISVGADFSIIAQYNHNGKNLDCRLSSSELEKIIGERICTDPSYFEDLKKEIADNKNKSGDSYVCSICNSSICVGPKGNVFPCVGWANKILGNIRWQNLQDIWLCSDEVKFLRTIQCKDFVECMNCSSKEFCSVCMVRNSNESSTGNPFELSRYFCNIANIKKNAFNQYKKNISVH